MYIVRIRYIGSGGFLEVLTANDMKDVKKRRSLEEKWQVQVDKDAYSP